MYFLKIVSIFIALLFLDALRTCYIITLRPEKEGFNSGLDGYDGAARACVVVLADSLPYSGDPSMVAAGVTAQRKSVSTPHWEGPVTLAS